ncbi:MAG: Flp pilus assembly protein CpaB [Thiobacillus sp.]|nr:Flp pilus assembly protein CpaB [Thiobacillus sp.]
MLQLSPRNRNLIVLLAALVVGGLAAFAAQRFLRGKVEEIEAREKNQATVRLVVAKENLEKGTRLGTANLAIRPVPREWAHSGAITPEQFGRADGAVLAYPAQAGEPVLWAQLEGQRAPSLAAQLAPGRRAVTVPVDEISSVSGMVEPGDLIDIVVSVRKASHAYTFNLLQGIRVLATGQQTALMRTESGEREETFSTITLDTTPEDAKRVIAAREIGKVTALLRAPGDRNRVSGARSEAQGLLGLADPVSSRVPVIYGGGPIGEVRRLGARPDEAEGPGGGL